jgi:glucose-6-phosphate isomerase
MIIVFHKDTILTPHRHPVGRSESYHVIEGAMNVYFFDDNGKVIGIIKLEERSKNYNFYYRLSSHTWHLPVPTTEYMVYHETITGPFLTEADIEYPTWKDKYDTAQKINHFLILQKQKCIR